MSICIVRFRKTVTPLMRPYLNVRQRHWDFRQTKLSNKQNISISWY